MTNETLNDGMIERYLGGEMSDAERQSFETRLESDERLRRSLRIEQAMTMAIAIDRSTPPARQPRMRARAIDAISRIAPAPLPVVAPEASRTSPAGGRSRRALLYSGFGLMMLAGGGWFYTHTSETTSAPAAPAVQSIGTSSGSGNALPAHTADPAAPAPVGSTSPATSATPSEQANSGDVRESSENTAARTGRRAQTATETRAKAAGSNQTRQRAVDSETPKKELPVFRNPETRSPLDVQNEGNGDK